MNKPTASGLGRAMACGASLRLPVIRSTSAHAERGTWRHAFLAAVGKVGFDAALAEVPAEHRDACAALPLDELPTDLAAEVAFAYDVATGEAREIGRDVGRNYGALGPMEIAGSADVVGLDDERVVIVDWKGPGNRERARDSVQLRFLALAACRAYGKDAATVELVKLGDHGEVYRSRHEYDVLDLDAFAAELREWFARAGQDDTPVEGPWCNYCPSWQSCPAKTALLRQAAAGDDIAAPFMGGLSRHSVGAAHVLAENLRALARELDKRVAAAIDELGPCPTPRGTVLKRALVDGNEQLDGDLVWDAVTRRYGADVADAAVERKATKAKLKAALKAAGVAVAPAEREILDEVRRAGGARRPRSERLVEVDPAEEKVA